MKVRDADSGGFSLVEVIIAMLLLAVIAVAVIPVLWQGIALSSQQATVATATRQLNSLVEQARDGSSCSALTSAAASQTFTDGAGRSFQTSGTAGPCTMCPSEPGAAIALSLNAVQGTRQLATVSALVFVTGAKAAATCT